MGANSEVIVFPPGNSGKILKWKVKEGTFLSIGRVILLYDVNSASGEEDLRKLKATQMGMVRKLLAREGETIEPGRALLELEDCTHHTVMNAMCAECGADLRTENETTLNASVPMVHSIPELKVSREQAESIGKADEERLLKHRKLVLLVDLDQTLIHTTNDNIPPNIKDVCHFQLYGPTSPWYHTRIRPGTHNFLKEMSQFYELHICTFGARNYAHMIAMFLDRDGKYFSHRILSRDECFNSNSKTANLSALFPCGDNMVCIIDDREDVWNFAPNLIHVKPYHFFKHTGDINAPPGLTKHENDEKEGFDFSSFGSKILNNATEVNVESNDSNIPQVTNNIKDDDTKSPEEGTDSKPNNADSNIPQVTNNIKDDDTKTPEVDTDSKPNNADSNIPQLTNKIKDDDTKSPGVGTDSKPNNADLNIPQVTNNIKDDDIKTPEVDTDSKPNNAQEEPKANTHNEPEKATKIRDGERAIEISGEGVKDELSGRGEEKSQEVSIPDTNSINNPDTKNEAVENVLVVNKQINNICRAEDGAKQPDKEEMEIEDTDDYLLHLEGILKTIHHAFYELYDELQGDIPDLKSVIPYVRRKVLTGANLVFSGLVPTNVPLEKSRAYQVARSLGATVSPDITPKTTHVVAVRPGTAKVNTARRMKHVIIVTPEWLWTCAERWECAEERLFPLGRGHAWSRHPPPHCGSPEHRPGMLPPPGLLSARFMDSINPLMTFSTEDIANMDREVEDIFNESESDGENEEVKGESPEEQEVRRAVLQDESSSSSSADSLSGEHPHGWRTKDKQCRKRTATDSDTEEVDEDMPSTKFRRGEALPSDLELGEDDSASAGSEEPPDEMDDGDWNMMGAALEREFLSGDRDSV